MIFHGISRMVDGDGPLAVGLDRVVRVRTRRSMNGSDSSSSIRGESRGIERSEAERMIALGFFEPAVSRFPTESLRDEIRSVLENKIVPRAVEPKV